MSESLLQELARPEILQLTAYASARSLVAESEGLRLLDANEAPAPLDPSGPPLHRYPSQQPAALVARLATRFEVAPSNLLVTRGSDEAIDLLVRAFCRAGADAIGICPPTYGMYRVAADLQGAATLVAPLTPTFAINTQRIADLLATPSDRSPRLKLLFLCSPGNPTGTGYRPDAIEAVLRIAAGRCLVVVDEAYAEFSSQPSAIRLLAQHPHLVVLRTLSKAWALAGARVGLLAAAPAIVAVLRKVLAPYPLPLPAVDAALAATGDDAAAAMRERVAAICAERARLTAALEALSDGLSVAPSETNFVLVRCPTAAAAAAVMSAARRRGLLLRDRSSEPGLAGCIRVTVGEPSDSDGVVAAFREVLV